MMPTAFLSHGAPNRILVDSPANRFLRGFGSMIKQPRGIVIISAHWQTRAVTLSAPGELKTIHDHYGFSNQLNAFSYAVQQTTELTDQLSAVLSSASIPFQVEPRGLDHGSWSVLSLAYPKGDIPVVNLSLPLYKDLIHYLLLGESLKKLRLQDILIIGSGSATHNLSTLNHLNVVPKWAKEFTDWLQQNVVSMNTQALLNIYQQSPHGRMAHPSIEHFTPLLIAAGASKGEKAQLVHDSYELGSLNNSSFIFGNIAS